MERIELVKLELVEMESGKKIHADKMRSMLDKCSISDGEADEVNNRSLLFLTVKLMRKEKNHILKGMPEATRAPTRTRPCWKARMKLSCYTPLILKRLVQTGRSLIESTMPS